MSIIDDLIKDVPAPQLHEFERIRNIVMKVCPSAVEVKTYGMPGYKYKNKYLLSFGNFKNHMSIFPGSEPIDKLKDDLEPFRKSKGTIQFTLDNNLTDNLIQRIVSDCVYRIDYSG